MIGKVISGGQTGVDRAALDVAMEYGIPHGGYCPRGRRAEDGVIPERYFLTELPTADYPTRTRKNIEEADGILIVACKFPLEGGTKLTADICHRLDKRFSIYPLRDMADVGGEEEFIRSHRSALANPLFGKDDWTLMIAGPRESKHPGIYDAAVEFLRKILPNLRNETK